MVSNPKPVAREGLAEALVLLEGLGRATGPTSWIGGVEARLVGATNGQIVAMAEQEGFGRETLDAALLIKRVSGQINMLVHAIGILNALPFILEPGEVIESLSLGAGNTGRRHDVETNLRIAEFKFIEWRGGPEAIRQNGVFADLFNLVTDPVRKRKVLYLVGTAIPMRFLSGGRALSSVMSHNVSLAKRFHEANGDRFRTVGEWYATVRDQVEVVDLAILVPGLGPKGLEPR